MPLDPTYRKLTTGDPVELQRAVLDCPPLSLHTPYTYWAILGAPAGLCVAGVLPDVLRPGLRVVFCGTAAGTASARAGAYYAGPGNRFWRTLHEIGLTPGELAPQEFQRLAEHGVGLTDICKALHGSDAEVGTAEFDVAGLAARVHAAEPENLAFNGKNAARGALEREVGYGAQPERVGGAAVWVLPSTSGAARRYWDVGPWRELARACDRVA